MWSPALARLRIAKVSAAWPGGQEQRGDAALERGDALLDDVLRRVHDPGVDVARLGQAEQRGGVLGVVEGVRRGLVDRQRPGVGGAVGRLAGVDLLGLERPVAVGSRFRCSWDSPGVMGRCGSDASRFSDSDTGPPHQSCLWGPVHDGPALAVQPVAAATQPGHHPGHPTAVGGLPASKPGLDAGTHDRQEAYRTRRGWLPAGLIMMRLCGCGAAVRAWGNVPIFESSAVADSRCCR